MGTIVRSPGLEYKLGSRIFLGELLEKVTRVLTEEDKKILDQEFVGKNGERRKVEVFAYNPADCWLHD